MSNLRIDREGIWHYREMEMTRRDIVTLFYQHLIRDNSGLFFVELGAQRYPVDIEDTAYVVRAVYVGAGEGAPDGSLYLLLSDDTIEEFDATTLRIGRDNIPYCRVKNGHDARFSSSSYYQLAELIEYDPQRNGYFIPVRGRIYYIPE